MRTMVIVALAIFWVVMAYREYQRGDMLLAGLFLGIGVVLTAYRLSNRPTSS